jgi:hypothetical protein
MSNLVKVEINIIGEGWQWMGKLSQEKLTELCTYADKLTDESMEAGEDE